MEFMLDTANLNDLKQGLDYLPVDGITSNPTILKADLPFEYFSYLKEIKELAGERTFHVQLGSLTCEEMVKEAETIWAELGKDVYLKIPVTQEGLKAIKTVKALGGRVTATAVYYTFQGLMAIHAGADYVAPYCNRMENNNIDFVQTIEELRMLIDRDGYDAKILAASFKNVKQITAAIAAGAHCVTVQPALIKTAMTSALVGDAVAAFTKDYELVIKGK